ncbi:Glycerol:H+ symporter (Gup1), putative [Penicillium digitatum]|uniref:Glycerol:H+ symporter (Gup1), putative n=3 Tax=Penicillium digitatum TaxID=36651 RepID=K9GBT0_PEND2|nr:Glycerol:H+ symporter (Gup1), putative [Penicillium digitatum Pd1]EKV16229.1 Glycerol:H+ symporter (Gup1), putative [Penicillium digitatum Pd1]EKV18622.1 Glycerol:H+ symporter (Gup1), putative [Penicillium digitatum PHI26]QQK42455.1 Glycerol:H+ symporter (Gup1), putative [Penicillium digitatum]
MPSILAWLRRVYSLDTLDTRFTSSATPAHTNTRPSAKDARNATAQGASSSLWRTPEFLVYYLFFIILVPLMFKTIINVSKESHPTYSTYSHLLSPGWIPGRQVDNSDAQYESFRNNIPALLLLLIAHPLARRVYRLYMNRANVETKRSSHSVIGAGEAQLEQRMRFDFWFGLIFIIGLHGVSALKVLLILLFNFRIGKDVPRAYVPAATWIFNIGILFANELSGGYSLERIAKAFASGSGASEDGADVLVQWGQTLDSLGGLMPRWEVLFKVAVLRLISFNMDKYWSIDYLAASPIEKKQLDPTTLSDRDRVRIPAEPTAFTFRNYIAYMLYSPLYLAGPILTFNDYVSQQRYTAASVTRARITMYAVRFGLTLLCMELILHYIYAVAISKANPDWSAFTPGQLSMLAFFNLHIIWLKLLIPWRFFRLWALIDGIDPPENMVRCMSNNYSALAFWRGWHRSYNRWIVRYIYIPLGGGGGRRPPGAPKPVSPPRSIFVGKFLQIRNFLLVFTFVALWHDINLRLLMWGWLITLFVLPEVLGGMLFPAHRWRSHPTAYRVLCGVGSVGNVLMMIIANLVGFALGLDGLKDLLANLTGSYSGLAYMISCCVVLFVGVQVMFEVREDELRAGINLKC